MRNLPSIGWDGLDMSNEGLLSRDRPKLTWDESVKRDLKDWNIFKEIALDRSAWRLAINVTEPWTYFFRVLSLAYPNLLGEKGYVVVVVMIRMVPAKKMIRMVRTCISRFYKYLTCSAEVTDHRHSCWRSLACVLEILPCNIYSTWYKDRRGAPMGWSRLHHLIRATNQRIQFADIVLIYTCSFFVYITTMNLSISYLCMDNFFRSFLWTSFSLLNVHDLLAISHSFMLMNSPCRVT